MKEMDEMLAETQSKISIGANLQNESNETGADCERT